MKTWVGAAIAAVLGAYMLVATFGKGGEGGMTMDEVRQFGRDLVDSVSGDSDAD